jgi:DNA mismatch endonuclease (patch repair protein)
VIFVHGCFWHQHVKCADGHVPKSNTSYWRPKLDRNVARDASNVAALIANGWKVETIWECETKDMASLKKRLRSFLGPRRLPQ